MGIWIRSQDKSKLIKCMNVRIREWGNDGSKIYDIIEFTDKYEIFLGKYKSKEKAIKVLDMIQDHIVNNDNIFRNVASEQDWVGEIVTHSNNVFQMPKDIIIIDKDDVEV